MGKLMGRLYDRTFLSRAFFVFFLVFCFSGCVGQIIKADRPKGVYHRIKKGETLWSIALAYHVRVQDLAEINNIDNPALIEKNEVIFIPDAKQAIDDVMSAIITQKASPPAGKTVKSSPAKKTDAMPAGKKTAKKEGEGVSPRGSGADRESLAGAEGSSPGETGVKAAGGGAKEKESLAESEGEDEEIPPPTSVKEGRKSAAETAAKQTAPAKGADELLFDRKRFIWPVKGNVAARFGIQPNGMFYNGIRITARDGQPVVASDSGTIIFSSSIKDYGETVIIKHADNYATVYTNLGSRLVKTDDKVKKGDQIALLGKAEKTTGTFMNFEIRHRNKARNPLFFLP
jgi:lipoprotein NlpD